MSSKEMNDFVDMEELSVVLSTPTQESSEEQVSRYLHFNLQFSLSCFNIATKTFLLLCLLYHDAFKQTRLDCLILTIFWKFRANTNFQQNCL